MDTIKTARQALKRVLFGSTSFSQYCPIGMRDPQSEVSVWLHGLGAPRDVTCSNVVAAARPFTVGIGLEGEGNAAAIRQSRPSLKFNEREGGGCWARSASNSWTPFPSGTGKCFCSRVETAGTTVYPERGYGCVTYTMPTNDGVPPSDPMRPTFG